MSKKSKRVKTPEEWLEFWLPHEKRESPVSVKSMMRAWIEKKAKEADEKQTYLSFTKREMYEDLGFDKPNSVFNTAWNRLAYAKGDLMSYDKDLKKWIWL